MKKTRLAKFLLRPPLRFCISVWIVALAAISASAALHFVGLGGRPWAVSVYTAAVLFFILSLYLILASLGIPLRAKNVKYVRKFFADWSFRTYVYASVSVVFNVCYVVFGIIIANIEQSVWLGALVGYHVFLAAARAVVMYSVWRKKSCDEAYKLRVYSMCGVVLVLLAFAIVPVIRLVLDDANDYNYFVSTVTYVSAIALYTFVKLGIALHNMRKARRLNDRSVIAVKNICFADALISLFALQAAMIKELGNDAELGKLLNPILGAVVALAIFAMGIYMFVNGLRRIKRLPPSDGETEEYAVSERTSEPELKNENFCEPQDAGAATEE